MPFSFFPLWTTTVSLIKVSSNHFLFLLVVICNLLQSGRYHLCREYYFSSFWRMARPTQSSWGKTLFLKRSWLFSTPQIEKNWWRHVFPFFALWLKRNLSKLKEESQSRNHNHWKFFSPPRQWDKIASFLTTSLCDSTSSSFPNCIANSTHYCRKKERAFVGNY